MALVRLIVSSLTAGAILMTGCGTSENRVSTDSDPTPATEEMTTASTASTSFTPDEEEVAGVVETYLDAMASGDFESACATRAAREVRQVSRLYGSCEAAFEAIVQSQGQRSIEALLGDAVASDVEIHGDRAGVFVSLHGPGKPIVLIAVRESGSWKLVDVPDAKADRFLKAGN